MLRLLVLTLLVAACDESFDAGRKQYGKLPVDGRNPVILLNDSADENWMGEYAMLLANSGGPELVGIILVTGGVNEDPKKNNKGWVEMVDAANKGGLRNIPDPTPSIAEELTKPASGLIADTDVSLNRSRGAHLIVDESKQRSLPYRPLVVVAAARLTDVASAYLMDPSVVDRVVVVASVGALTDSGADMDRPNGEMDAWASTIVATKFPYIQVSARYDSQLDVPSESLEDLPRNNSFSNWIYGKQPNIWSLTDAADQVAIAAVGIPDFVTEVDHVSLDPSADAGTSEAPTLRHDPDGPVLLVRGISPDTAINRFWQMLQDESILPPGRDDTIGTK